MIVKCTALQSVARERVALADRFDKAVNAIVSSGYQIDASIIWVDVADRTLSCAPKVADAFALNVSLSTALVLSPYWGELPFGAIFADIAERLASEPEDSWSQTKRRRRAAVQA